MLSYRFMPILASAIIMVFFLSVVPRNTTAGVIQIDPNGSLSQVNYSEPIGQSFTAEDAFVAAGLYFEAINPSSPNDSPIQYNLYAGVGVNGMLLASDIFNLSTGFAGFYLVDFSSVSLVTGMPYTLTASILGNNSPYWAVGGADPYAGGQAISSGLPVVYGDRSLLVNPLSVVSVPEPATLSLLGLGLAGLSAVRRRRKAKQNPV